MLGVLLAIGSAVCVSIYVWRKGKAATLSGEISLIRRCLADPTVSTSNEFVTSRPGRLVGELRQLDGHAELIVVTINEVLGDIERETQWTNSRARACVRVSATAGIAGGCIEIASRVGSSSARDAMLAVIAVAGGFVGASSCAVIGRWALRGNQHAHRTWDGFIQWLLNSDLLRTASKARGDGTSSEFAIRNGQEL